VVARPDNHLEIGMNAQGLGRDAMTAAWQPFFDWVAAEPGVRIATGPSIVAGAMRHRWDPDFLTAHLPQAIQHDDRPGASRRNIFWTANRAEAGHVIHGFESVWLPAVLLDPAQQPRLTDALWTATRWWPVEMHFQKGLAGAPPHVLAAARNTATNPAVLDAFMLAIIASEGPPAFPSLSGHEPDVAKARHDAARIAQAAAALRQAAPARGAYVVESDYHQSDWQRAYWGANYSRLLAIKRRYDPDGVFFVRHGVGSEGWSDDGFTRLA
jgi:FAD/FMN-containing dehydrogenase